MVVSLNLARARRDRIWAGTSPLAELMACLHVLAEPDHHPEARGWTARVTAGMSDSMRSDLFRFAPLWARYRMRLFYPVDGRLGRTLDEEVDRLVTADDDLFVPLVANAIRGQWSPHRPAAEVLGSRTWVRECELKSFVRGDLAHSLVADPDRFRDDLQAVLVACRDVFFEEEWERSRAVLESVAAGLVERIRTSDPAAVLTSVSATTSHRSTSDTVVFDKLQSAAAAVDEHGLVLVPSVRAWPHVMVKTDPGLPVVVHFLVQETVGKVGALSQQDLRRRLAVLAEPGRWELCRHLIGEPITTSELAARTNTTKYAVSRHLRTLRDAGLVSSQKDGRQVFHRLHPSAITNLGHDVLSGILR